MAPTNSRTGMMAGGKGRVHPLAKIGMGEKFFDGAGKSLGMISSMMFLPMMLLGAVAGFTAKRSSGKLHDTADKLSQFSALPNANLEDVPVALGKITPGLEKHVRSVGQYANRILGKDFSSRLGKVSTINALQLGISGFSVANTARTFGDKIRILKHLHRDVTGRDISTFALITGHNLPPIVKQARGRSLGLRVGLAAFMDVGLTAVNVATMLYPDKQPKFMQKGIFSNPIFQIVGMGALYQIPTMLASGGEDPLQVYREAHLLAARTPLPQEGYYTLIRSLAPDRMSDQEVAARAKQCYNEHWSPQEVAAGMAETFGRGGHRAIIGPATARLSAEGARQRLNAV